MLRKTLMTAVAVAALVGVASAAQAESVAVTTTTYTETRPVPLNGVTMINFSAFDANKDGIYTKDEVGERLFRIFDQDGNHMIDDQEWNVRNVLTIQPMEQTTVRTVDYGSDGIIDRQSQTYTTFLNQSGLARFTNNPQGLSAADFTDIPFNVVDTSGDHMIELNEWKTAYDRGNLTKPVKLDYPQDDLVKSR